MIRLEYMADGKPALSFEYEDAIQRRLLSHEYRKWGASGSYHREIRVDCCRSRDMKAWPGDLCDPVLNMGKAHLRLCVLCWAKPSAPQISAESSKFLVFVYFGVLCH